MNGVHLVTQEKKNESKRIENGSSAPSALPKASPGAQAARAPRAQRLPAARPAPCCSPARARARQRPCACRPARPSTLALRATPAHTRLPRAPGTPSTHDRPAPAARSPPSHARPAPASARLRTPSALPLAQWAVAHFRVCTKFFFSFFPYYYYYYYYFPVISSSWKITKIIIIFFHFLGHSNKF